MSLFLSQNLIEYLSSFDSRSCFRRRVMSRRLRARMIILRIKHERGSCLQSPHTPHHKRVPCYEMLVYQCWLGGLLGMHHSLSAYVFRSALCMSNRLYFSDSCQFVHDRPEGWRCGVPVLAWHDAPGLQCTPLTKQKIWWWDL